jgi:hypothetical protein
MELPDYIKVKSGSSLRVRMDSKWHTVTLKDIAYYYAHDARNISSGCRSLGSIVGDWRPIDNLAQECLYVFKQINIVGLRRACMKEGLEPKF